MSKTIMFKEPILAIYKYFNYNRLERQATPKVTNVEVLGESDSGKSYKVRILNNEIENHKKGDIIWVSKNNIDNIRLL